MIEGYVQFAGDRARSVVLTSRGHAVLNALAQATEKLAAD
jgi:hypothetical protein